MYIVNIGGINSAQANENDSYVLQFPEFHLEKREKIAQFQIIVNAGIVRSISNLPVGWRVTIDNDPSWTSNVIANVTVGSDSLNEKTAKELKLTVIKNEIGDEKFHFSGIVMITEDFRKMKKIILKEGDLICLPEGRL